MELRLVGPVSLEGDVLIIGMSNLWNRRDESEVCSIFRDGPISLSSLPGACVAVTHVDYKEDRE